MQVKSKSLSAKSLKPIWVLVLLCGVSIHAATIGGRVAGVADGDTVTVLDAEKVQHKIRLGGIDALERKQDFGNRSKQSLSDLMFSRLVAVESTKKDRYGRAVGKVLVDGVDANLIQIESGYAWHYKEYEGEQSAADRRLYESAELKAKAARRGQWRDAEPVAPWDWRKLQRLYQRSSN